MAHDVTWREVKRLLEKLYDAVEGLERLFPGRKFTLDGHLVGSVGEVIAAYMFDLELLRASTRAHDATHQSGRQVEIKLTQGRTAALRHEPDHLIVLQRPKGKTVSVVYNGPGELAWKAAGKMASNGQRSISAAKLRKLNAGVAHHARLREVRTPPV